MRITQEKMDAIAVLMDDETREKVHHELAPCEPKQGRRPRQKGQINRQ